MTSGWETDWLTEGPLDTLLSVSPVGVAVLDRELRIVRLNAPFAAFLGREISEATGQPVSAGGG